MTQRCRDSGSPLPVPRRRLQIPLSWLLATPLLFAPAFLGFSLAYRVPPDSWELPDAMPITIAVLFYVMICCWIAIRHLDRFNEFRRFPFRGSMLLGGSAGVLFGVQFAIGLLACLVLTGFGQTAVGFSATKVLFSSVYTGCVSGFVGGLLGLYCGIFAGGIYCLMRLLFPSWSKVLPKSQR